MNGNALQKHSLHEKTAASVLLQLFISDNIKAGLGNAVALTQYLRTVGAGAYYVPTICYLLSVGLRSHSGFIYLLIAFVFLKIKL